jgi:NADH-quinone oxidoreductase subunit H
MFAKNQLEMENKKKNFLSQRLHNCFFFSNTTSFILWNANTEHLLKKFSDFINFSVQQIFIASLLKIVFILIAVAYFTIAERKVMAAIQRRKGPNVVGFWGLLQPLADGAKLLLKELLVPTRANPMIFLAAPIMVLTLSIVSWSIIPSGLVVESTTSTLHQITTVSSESHIDFMWGASTTADISYGVLFLLAVSGLNVYGIVIAGWASNSKYAFLGALRSAAQMISYEVSLGLLILPVILLAGSLNLTDIVAAQERTVWFVFPLLPCAIMFFISMLAETNRAPFDLPEAEAELVAGYNVEYSSIIFAMFFLGEYSNMLLMATVIVLFFFGGWLAPTSFLNFIPASIFFSLKIVFFCYLFILVRAAFPRYRYDQLMDLGWKTFLPLSLGYLLFITGVLVVFDGAPQVLEIEPRAYTETFFFIPENANFIH